jgi:predicted ATPase
MSITSIEVSGLRSFATNQELKLALPCESLGSGLTVLVGPNNGGKSTVIEAFAAFTQKGSLSFTEGKRNKAAGDVVAIRAIDSNGESRRLATVGAGGSEATWDDARKPPEPSTIFVLPSRRTFSAYFGKGIQSRADYIASSGPPAMRTSSIDRFSNRLFQIQENKAGFDMVLGKLLNPVPSWYIDQADSGNYYLKFKTGASFHNSEGIGEGYISLLFIVDALYDSQPAQTVVIDEPELSLHPSLQRKLIRVFAEYAADRQIVISTHSPYFIDWESIVNGGKVVRVTKSNHESVFSELSRGTVGQLKGFISNLYNPHILGLDAREVFFLDDGVVLVEGQEDVIQYKRILEQLAIEVHGDFFGWGVGGADNMKIVATMLLELGFEKVIGILDKNRADLVPKLGAEFPKYKFLSIPADDVRTKPVMPSKGAVSGLLDEKGNLRSEHEGPLRSIFAEVNAFLTR